MSRINQPPEDKLLLEAVELRIAGLRWEVVATKLNRSVRTVKRWPVQYPERWQAAIERAESRMTIDSNAESVVVLRNMLRDDDIKMRWHAAKTLVGLRIDLGKLGVRLLAARGATGPVPTAEEDADVRFFRYLKSQSAEQLDEMYRHLAPMEHDTLCHAPVSAAGDPGSTCAESPAAHDTRCHAQNAESP